MNIDGILSELGVVIDDYIGNDIEVITPIDGSIIAKLVADTSQSANEKINKAKEAFIKLREIPAPKRGEIIRIFGDELRRIKEPLAHLVTVECGKILEEGRGEVQEMIDICDFAVGLSRTIGGLTLPSERPLHVMQENWYPLGVVGVISAFNFPVAVWAWNFALAFVCGNAVIWKPSEKTPLCAIACHKAFMRALSKTNIEAPENLSQILLGFANIGELMIRDRNVNLISATGSTNMGRAVAPQVASRFGKTILELGGNNAVIVTESANLDVALPSILFGSVGTAGQRCTTTRRAFIHHNIYEKVWKRLKKAYESLDKKIGDPLDSRNLIGPLIDKKSYENMQDALSRAKSDKAKIIGGERLDIISSNAYYVKPALVHIEKQTRVVMEETFAPILYVMPYKTLEEVMYMHNDVPQGLSSAIFTSDLREAEFFKQNSDCGIANVNIGTSGAEIGGAFGGEKETGGGRESGSDSWKSYMRRQTSTTYYGEKAPALAQGIKFE